MVVFQVRWWAQIKGQQASFRVGSRAYWDTVRVWRDIPRTSFTVFDRGVWCTVAVFHFPPVRPGVLLPHLCEVLGSKKFVEFLDA